MHNVQGEKIFKISFKPPSFQNVTPHCMAVLTESLFSLSQNCPKCSSNSTLNGFSLFVTRPPSCTCRSLLSLWLFCEVSHPAFLGLLSALSLPCGQIHTTVSWAQETPQNSPLEVCTYWQGAGRLLEAGKGHKYILKFFKQICHICAVKCLVFMKRYKDILHQFV